MKIKNLHQLINALNKGEKRQLNVSPKKQEESLGVRLYAYLSRKKEYNQHTDNKANKLLANTSRPDQVLSSLAEDISLSLSIQNNYSQKIQIYKLLLEAEFYHNKELYKLMLRALKKAKKIASDCEYFELHLEILGRIRLYYSINKENTIKNPKDAIELERKEILGKINNLDSFKETYTALIKSFRQSHQTDDSSAFEKLANSPILSGVANAKSIKAKGTYYKCHMMITHLKGDHAKGLRMSLDYLNILSAHPTFVKTNKADFLATNQYYLAKCLDLKELDGLEEKIEAVYAVPTDNEKDNKFKYEILIPIILEFYNLPSQDSKPLDDYLPNFEQFFEENQEKLSELFKIIITAGMSRTYFMLGNTNDAKRWINLQRANHPKGLRLDLKIFARVLEQFIDLEEGSYFVVKSRIPGIKVALENHNQYGKMEKIILRFLSKYSNLLEKLEYQKVPIEAFIVVLNELKTKLNSISQEERKTRFLQYLDYEYWADKKIRKLHSKMELMS